MTNAHNFERTFDETHDGLRRRGPVSRVAYTACLALGLLMVGGLMASGRIWWCAAGDAVPWSWDTWSRHNSQHWVDPYSLSHLQHGIGLFLLLVLVAPRSWTASACFIVVATVEVTWELFENTPWMIDRYRSATISLDYFGDSICNSIGDYLACLAGIAVTRRIPVWIAWSCFVALEVASLIWIRDSLMLNIWMLIWPTDAIRNWQLGQ